MNDNAKPNEQHREGEELAPAAGGTFGVTSDESGYGTGPTTDELARDRAPMVDESGASYSGANFTPDSEDYAAVPRDYSEAADDNLSADEFIDPNDGYSSSSYSSGNYSGDSYEGGNYETAADPYAAPAHPDSRGDQVANLQLDEARRNHPAYGQFNNDYARQSSADHAGNAGQSGGTLAYVALACAILGLILLCIPGIAWIFGGVLGVAGVVTGFLATRGKHREFGWLAVAGGGIAVALAVATAIVVYLV